MAQQLQAFNKQLATHEKQFSSLLPAHISAKKFMRTVANAVEMNPDILNCAPNSIFKACQQAAQDGLLLDGKEAAIVKFGDQATYMKMVAGVLKLIRNSQQVTSLNVFIVRANDHFKYNPSIHKLPDFDPLWFGDRGEVVGAWAYAELKDGSPVVEILTMQDIEKIKAASRTSKSGPWRDWEEEMIKKSALRRLAKYLPSSADIIDDTIADYDDTPPPPIERDITPKQSGTRAAAIVEEYVDTETGEIVKDDDVI